MKFVNWMGVCDREKEEAKLCVAYKAVGMGPYYDPAPSTSITFILLRSYSWLTILCTFVSVANMS